VSGIECQSTFWVFLPPLPPPWLVGVLDGFDPVDVCVPGDEVVELLPAELMTQNSAPSAATRPTTARIRAVGKPERLATIPWASRRRVNQSSSPSSPRGGSNPPPPGLSD
jgi:hypothetical protein